MTVLIRRERCLRLLRAGKDMTDVVKVVTGMRRVGKSTLLKLYIGDLLESGVREEDIIFLNMDTFEFRSVRSNEELDTILLNRIEREGFKYVFIDEIQNVKNWEYSVSSLINTERCDIYITGSNSKMLSSDLTTRIAGRFVEIQVLPLSFPEYLELHPGDADNRFDEYLKYGALPEVSPGNPDFYEMQITGIFNTVIVQDVLSRVNSGNVETLKSISRYLFSNIGNVTNIDTIAKILGLNPVTVKKYVSLLEEAFLFHRAEKYDVVGKKLLKTNNKYYATDLGMRRVALGGHMTDDISRPLENIVYLELIRRGYVVHMGSFYNREIDFTAMKSGKTEYYQICQTMLDSAAREREVRGLLSIKDNYPKTVLTMDTFGLGSDCGVNIVNVIEWLRDG